MKLFLLLLLAFFHVGIDEPGAPGDPETDGLAKPADPADDVDVDPAEPADDDPVVTGREELETARREAKSAKDDAERYQRELAEARAQRQAPRVDDAFAQEEVRLKDPAITPQEKWQIDANRAIRANGSAAHTALAQAEDVRDQTAFSRLAMTEPALHKRYEAKVEQELGKARQQGYNPKREFIYNQLIAKDMREGKFKKKAAPAADDVKGKTVNRGKLPGVKSDVGGRGGMSEHEKRRARLENVQI